MREGQSTKEIKFWPPSRKDREVKATTAGKPGNAKLLHQGRPTRVSHYIRERYYTKEGRECVFPFKYKEVVYTKCTSIDVYQPWCATEFNTADNLIGGWGLCLEDCEYEEPIVSCLEPPPVPQFGIRNNSGFN